MGALNEGALPSTFVDQPVDSRKTYRSKVVSLPTHQMDLAQTLVCGKALRHLKGTALRKQTGFVREVRQYQWSCGRHALGHRHW